VDGCGPEDAPTAVPRIHVVLNVGAPLAATAHVAKVHFEKLVLIRVVDLKVAGSAHAQS